MEYASVGMEKPQADVAAAFKNRIIAHPYSMQYLFHLPE